jgi:hypothetical protein
MGSSNERVCAIVNMYLLLKKSLTNVIDVNLFKVEKESSINTSYYITLHCVNIHSCEHDFVV